MWQIVTRIVPVRFGIARTDRQQMFVQTTLSQTTGSTRFAHVQRTQAEFEIAEMIRRDIDRRVDHLARFERPTDDSRRIHSSILMISRT